MRLIEFINIAAVLLSPLIAVQVSFYVERLKRKRERKDQIFKTLMATRATKLDPQHVRALNGIFIEFYGEKRRDKAVVAAWTAYQDQLNNLEQFRKSRDVWQSAADVLFIDLMYKMGECLNYDLDRTAIKNTGYVPEAHAVMEDGLRALVAGLGQLVTQSAPATQAVPPAAPTPEQLDQQAREREQQAIMTELVKNYLSGKVPMRVVIVNDAEASPVAPPNA